MKQAVMTVAGKIEFRDVDKPRIKSDEVLIQIKRLGICGSDIHVFHGTHPYTDYPVVQGHEVSGVVAQIGESVRDFEIGDRVTIMPQVTCGTCYPCRHGRYHICDSLKVMGFQTDGAAQEYFAVSADNVLKIPAKMSLEQGAMVEPTAVAVHALDRAGIGMEGGMSGKKVFIGDAIMLARKGSTIVVVGVFGKKPTVDLGLVQDRELNLIGTLMYQRKDYESAMLMSSAGKIKLQELITDTFRFEGYPKAYSHVVHAKDRAIKVMIEL